MCWQISISMVSMLHYKYNIHNSEERILSRLFSISFAFLRFLFVRLFFFSFFFYAFVSVKVSYKCCKDVPAMQVIYMYID